MNNEKKLIKNKAQCRNCGDIIESKHRHDFVECRCSEESERLMNEFPKEKRYLPKEKWNDETGSWTKEYFDYQRSMHGIAIDGGLTYQRVLYYNKNDFIDLSEYE